MNKFYKEHIDEVEQHELEELELFSIAMDYLSFKYELRHDAPISYWIDIYWESHYVPILIAFKENDKNVFCYSVLYSKKDEDTSAAIFEKRTDSIVELVKDIDGMKMLIDKINQIKEPEQ